MRKLKKVLLTIVTVICTLVIVVTVFGLIINNNTIYQQEYLDNVRNTNEMEIEIIDNENSNVQIKLKENQDLKILQLTDTHISGIMTTQKNDQMALEAIETLVINLDPDLIIITGDMIFPSLIHFSFNNIKAAQILSALMEKLGVPWAYVYGNHDSETYGIASAEELNEIFCSNKYCLNRLPDSEEYYQLGRMHQVIEVLNYDNTLNQALILMDSNAYEEDGGYAHITDPQVAWYEQQIITLKEQYTNPSSLLFFHIPLQEYKTAYDLYKEGSSDVTYHFGEWGEDVCCSSVPSSMFSKIVELGSSKAVFVGHDHVNNYSITYQGVNLVYGLSIDYLAYFKIASQTSQRGGTIITLNSEGYTVTQHKLIDIVNN